MAEKANKEVSYDILEWFPILYCQNVFKYLSGKDVLQASAVNKEWYKFTAENQQTAKYKLFFSGRSPTAKDKEILKNSKRRYQNILLNDSPNEIFFLELLAGRAKCWKSVEIFLANFEEEDTLTELLRIIEPTVEYLEIHELNVLKESADVDVKLSFPQLRSLILCTPADKFNIYKYFHNCANLKQFTWYPEEPAPNTMNHDILIFLYNNPKLEDLDMFTADCDWLQQAHEFKFKLCKLVLSSSEAWTGMEPHLKAFLRIHAQTLESLELGEMLDQELLELILTGMPRLTTLTTEIYELEAAISGWEGEFPVNTAITTLNLTIEVADNELFALEELVRALPSLKHTTCCEMNNKMMFVFAEEVPGLESIEARDFDVRQFPSGVFFPNFKKFKARKLRKDLHEPIGNGNFAVVVRKAMREYFGDDSELSFDPLERFPIPYCREVFKYLSGKDMLEASAVSRKWYKFTGESQQASKYKLALNTINQQNLTAEAKEMLRNSIRCYQNIEFDGVTGDGLHFFINLLGVGAGGWKSVTLRDVFVDKESTFNEIFQTIEPSVEELTVAKIRAKELEDALPDWSFPNLKSLICDQIPGELNFNKYFYGCQNLSKLKWHTTRSKPAKSSDTATARISRMLCKNHDLKHLDLWSSDFMSFSRVHKIKFKLRELRINAHGLSLSRTHLFAFVEAQAQTLELLELKVRFTQELLELILTRMPKLTSFAMEVTEVEDAFFDWEGEYPVNTTITTLNILVKVEKTRQLVPLEILIKAMPKLKNLKCKNLNEKLLNFLAREVPALESVDTREIKVSRFPEGNFFPNFKTFKGEMLRKDYIGPTGDGNFAAVVRKEMERYFTEDCSYDVFEWFPIRVCQNVFKYLRGRDVLQASRVNKKWYKFTAESQQAAKLQLRFSTFNEQYLTVEAKEMLKSSKRQYLSIKLDQGLSSEHLDFYFELLAHRAGYWKSVTLVMNTADKDGMARLIRTIEPTVVELTIAKMNLGEASMDVESKWSFPNLKSLQVYDSGNFNHNVYEYFVRCTSLVKFECSSLTEWTPGKLDILKMLRNNQNLKELDTKADGVLFEHSPEFSFQLEKLRLILQSAAAENLNSFLETHAPTLETLDIKADIDHACLELILGSMPRLKSLTTHFDKATFDCKQTLPKNTTIISYEFRHGQDYVPYENVVGSMLGLKHFKGRVVTDEVLLSLSQNVPNLEKLEVGELNISRFPECNIFPNIKLFTVCAFPENLQEPTGDGNFKGIAKALMKKYSKIMVIDSYSDLD